MVEQLPRTVSVTLTVSAMVMGAPALAQHMDQELVIHIRPTTAVFYQVIRLVEYTFTICDEPAAHDYAMNAPIEALPVLWPLNDGRKRHQNIIFV